MTFFLETLIGGLLAGTMYSLAAIGFVLIYKASGVFNFAQGATLLFSALLFVTLREAGTPFALALLLTIAALALLAVLIERLVLRPLTNRSPMTLFMATLGLSYIIEGVAQGVMGANVHALELGIADQPIFIGDILISQFVKTIPRRPQGDQ
jgi:branched-chain amino acid transport system permease protein